MRGIGKNKSEMVSSNGHSPGPKKDSKSLLLRGRSSYVRCYVGRPEVGQTKLENGRDGELKP